MRAQFVIPVLASVLILGIFFSVDSVFADDDERDDDARHYDDYERDDTEYFQTEWVNSIHAMYLKKKQLYKRQFQCPECLTVWESYVTKNTTEIECPECDD